MNRVLDWLTYAGYSILWRLVRLLPEPTAYAFFLWVAKRTYRRNGKRVKRLRANYRQAQSDISGDQLEALVRSGLENAMRYWCDTFRISDWNKERVFNSVSVTNEHLLLDGIRDGRGVIVALPHAGNWDHAGLYFCAKGIPVFTVAEHLRPERLFRKFLQHRQRMGMTVLDLDAGVLPQLAEFLREGKLVALVADRDLSKSGIEVSFFGATAKMPAGPARLAIETNARLITAFVGYRDDGIHITFSGPVKIDRSAQNLTSEVARVTQELAEIFEHDITQDLVSWHMQQRIFIEPRGQR
ncbi:MAG: phosphatidylinositol mannoside acyltransferase [Actinobacteria bacterium]|nr:phosphatidylinositol mannoside acyltransferase [Actinomycetota bacterium]